MKEKTAARAAPCQPENHHTRSARHWIAVRRVAAAGAVVAVSTAALLAGYGVLVEAVGVPMRAGDPFADAAQPLGPADFAGSVVFATVLGTLFAVCVSYWAARPSRTFVRAALPLLAVSLLAPTLAVDTATSTRIALGLGHLLAGAVVIPVLTYALKATSPGH